MKLPKKCLWKKKNTNYFYKYIYPIDTNKNDVKHFLIIIYLQIVMLHSMKHIFLANKIIIKHYVIYKIYYNISVAEYLALAIQINVILFLFLNFILYYIYMDKSGFKNLLVLSFWRKRSLICTSDTSIKLFVIRTANFKAFRQ